MCGGLPTDLLKGLSKCWFREPRFWISCQIEGVFPKPFDVLRAIRAEEHQVCPAGRFALSVHLPQRARHVNRILQDDAGRDQIVVA